MKTIEGKFVVQDEKFCIVISRFNEFIGSKLLSGAVDELERHGVSDDNIDVIWVPGAFEIPVIAKKAPTQFSREIFLPSNAAPSGTKTIYKQVIKAAFPAVV